MKPDTMCSAGICCSRGDTRGRPGAGVDDADTYGELCEFVRVVSEGAPVTHFVVHCRKAILGLDPGANRSVPPLRRGWAFALRRDFPHLRFSVNGQVGLPPASCDCTPCGGGESADCRPVVLQHGLRWAEPGFAGIGIGKHWGWSSCALC